MKSRRFQIAMMLSFFSCDFRNHKDEHYPARGESYSPSDRAAMRASAVQLYGRFPFQTPQHERMTATNVSIALQDFPEQWPESLSALFEVDPPRFLLHRFPLENQNRKADNPVLLRHSC
jgi:hypothetical protein